MPLGAAKAALLGAAGAGGLEGTFEFIAEAAGAGSSSTIILTSIPQTYTDLKVIIVKASTTSTDNVQVTINAANQYHRQLFTGPKGGFSWPYSSTWEAVVTYNQNPAETPSLNASVGPVLLDFDTHNYATASINKTLYFDYPEPRWGTYPVLIGARSVTSPADNGTGTAYDAAITSMQFDLAYGSNWTSADTITLYGIKDTV